MITHDRLKELLHYNPDTGVFTNRVRRGGNALAGGIAGCITNKGYVHIRIDGKDYQAHRLAWLYVYGEFPKIEIDHINHIRSDNRISKLRLATHQENGKNQSKHCTNTSGHTGIHIYETVNGGAVFYARLEHSGEVVLSKGFSSLKEAIIARKASEVEFGFHPNHGK